MKEIIKTAAVALILLLAIIAVVITRGDDTTDWSKFNINVAEEEDSFSYEIVPSEYNGTYSNITKHKLYAMVGKNPDGTYRMYFVRAIGKIKSVILRIDDLTLDANGTGRFSTEGISGTTTVSYLNVAFTKEQVRVYTGPDQAGSSDIQGMYNKYGDIARFSLRDFYFLD